MMTRNSKPTESYIQLVEAFIEAISNGKTGEELEQIRRRIRAAAPRHLQDVPQKENAETNCTNPQTPDDSE